VSFDQNRFDAELRRRIKEAEEQLRKLPDDELMQLHEGVYDQPEHKQDSAFMAAIYNEVRSFPLPCLAHFLLKLVHDAGGAGIANAEATL